MADMMCINHSTLNSPKAAEKKKKKINEEETEIKMRGNENSSTHTQNKKNSDGRIAGEHFIEESLQREGETNRLDERE